MKTLSGWGLCLSGGGYRASLFHLGAARRLHELGILQKITRLSSVSGGSIFAAHLADILIENEQSSLSFKDWDSEVATTFRKYVRKDIRTGLFLRHLAWNWARPGPRARGLEKKIRKNLTDKKLSQLPVKTELEFIFLATDMESGTSWRFTREEIGSYKPGRWKTPEDMPLAKAVAASACFPPLFGPIEVSRTVKTGADNPGKTQKFYLTDGGVYDNTGMEPVWNNNKVVLVSDCGAPFVNKVGKNYIARLMRYASIGLNQVGALRKRALIRRLDPNYQTFRVLDGNQGGGVENDNPCPNAADPQCHMNSLRATDQPVGTYWRLESRKESYVKNASAAFASEIGALKTQAGWYGYSQETVEGYISKIRTDLDSFTSAESAILENHGYFLADLAIRRHVPEIRVEDAPFNVPHPDFTDEKKVQKELKNSGSRLAFWMRWFNRGRLFG